MTSVSVQLKVLGSSSATRAAVIVAQCGKRILLRSSDALAAGTLVQANSADQVILGEVIGSRATDGSVELFVEAYHSFRQTWVPDPAWREDSAPESVLDSLWNLNRRLQAIAPVEPMREASTQERKTRRTA